MNDRLKQFIEYLGISTRGFEQKISVSNGLIARFLSKNTTIQSDVLSKICDTFPDLNPDWLLTGKGKMLHETTPASSSDGTVALLLEQIKDLAQNVGRLQAENNELKNKLARSEERLAASATAAAG